MMEEDTEVIKHALWTVAMVAVGYYLGAWYTGRVAYQATLQTQFVGVMNTTTPAWVETVKTSNLIALGVFGGCLLLWIGVDYYGEE